MSNNTRDTNMSALAVIVDYDGRDDRILAVTNRRYGGLGLPGGKVEEGESPKAACCRELAEETGLSVISAHLALLGVRNWSARRVHVYHVAQFSGLPLAIEPGTELRWVQYHELLEGSPFRVFYEEFFSDGIHHLRLTKGAR